MLFVSKKYLNYIRDCVKDFDSRGNFQKKLIIKSMKPEYHKNTKPIEFLNNENEWNLYNHKLSSSNYNELSEIYKRDYLLYLYINELETSGSVKQFFDMFSEENDIKILPKELEKYLCPYFTQDYAKRFLEIYSFYQKQSLIDFINWQEFEKISYSYIKNWQEILYNNAKSYALQQRVYSINIDNYSNALLENIFGQLKKEGFSFSYEIIIDETIKILNMSNKRTQTLILNASLDTIQKMSNYCYLVFRDWQKDGNKYEGAIYEKYLDYNDFNNILSGITQNA